MSTIRKFSVTRDAAPDGRLAAIAVSGLQMSDEGCVYQMEGISATARVKQFVYRSVTFLRQPTLHTFLALLSRNRAHLRLLRTMFVYKQGGRHRCEENRHFHFWGLTSKVFLAGCGSGSYCATLEGTYDHCARLFRWVNTEPFPLTPLTGLSKIFTNQRWTFDEWRRLQWTPF
jgi:hypothetical protein